MSGRFVRASKYRNVFGQAAKKELSYDNLKVTKNAWDSNLIKTNGKYLSVNWESSGGGAFAVIPLAEVGKAPDSVPLCRGHTATVLDTDWNPFDSQKLVSVSDDGKIGLWEIPEDYSFVKRTGDEVEDLKPYAFLTGHTRKVGHVQFHPLAENVLASSSLDYTVKIWNLETQKCEITLQHKDLVTSFCFNHNGTLLATTSRDKKIRVWDIIKGEIISEGPGHTGAKAAKCCWLGNTDYFVTTGFDRSSERELCIWDAYKVDQGSKIGQQYIDASSGTLMPFYDEATKLLFIAGKGDGNVRYYEFDEDEVLFNEVDEFKSLLPQRGFAIVPKRYVSIKDNEIVKAFKTVNDSTIDQISFIVPRRSEMFQDDIFPDCPSDKPALTAEEFFAGKTVDGPLLMSMRDIYEGKAPTVTASKPKETTKPKEAPAPAPTPVQKEEATPVQASREVTPSPALTKTQEQGVDDLLKKTEVDSLLDKVNNLSDAEDPNTPSEDDNDEWEAPKSTFTPKDTTPKVFTPNVSIPKEAPKVTTPEPTVASAPKETPSKATEPTEETKPEPSAAPVTKAAPGGGLAALKITVDKLTSIAEQLESTVSTLIAANLAKDDRISALEAKIEKLLKKN